MGDTALRRGTWRHDQMALKKATITTPVSWFLVARRGDLLLRLRDELLIGEDEAGDLLLTAVAGQPTVAITTLDNHIALRSFDNGWMLVDQDSAEADEDPDEQSVNLIECNEGETVSLSLPNNTFTLTGDPLNHGAISRTVTLLPRPAPQPIKAPRREPGPGTNDATDTIIVKEAPPVLDVVDESSNAAFADDDGIPTLEILAESPGPAVTTPRAVESAPVLPAQAPETQPGIKFVLQDAKPSPADIPQRNSYRPKKLVLIGVIVGLLVGVYLVRTPATDKPVEGTASPPRNANNLELLGSSSQRLPISPKESAADSTSRPDVPVATNSPMQEIETPAPPPDIAPQVSITAPAAALQAPAAVLKEPAATLQTDAIDVPPAWLETRLEEAETLLAAGTIYNVGERNAVQVLTEILRADPDNEQAMQLMYQCANDMLAEATAARDAGDEYQARNLVEEVLAFHPSHPGALDLRRQLF